MEQFQFKFKKRGGGKSPSLKDSMVLLDHKGVPQMYMKGGELIFSRVSTKQIIKLAEKAAESKSEKDFFNLGETVLKERMAQRKRDGY
jgi:hypothetical protein